MAKPSEIFARLGSLAKNAMDVGSHVHTAFSLLGAARGGEEPSADASGAVKGLYGVFGHADERAWQILEGQLKPEELSTISAFLERHFLSGSSAEKVLSWWYGNQFRTFVTKMGSTQSAETGATEQVQTIHHDNPKKTVRTRKRTTQYKAGTNNSLNFLKKMVAIIESEEDPEDGYKKLVTHFKRTGVPHYPEDTVAALGEISGKVGISLGQFSDALDEADSRIKAKIAFDEHQRSQRSKLSRWLDKLIRWDF